MKFNHRLVFSAMLATTLIYPIITLAQANTNQLTILNNFDKPLTYTVGRNPEVLPDVPETFTLKPTEGVTTRVLDLQKEAYIRAEDIEQDSAFWGVEVVDDHVKVHGYMDHGIAYSWNTEKVVFCTPEEYKKKNSCF